MSLGRRRLLAVLPSLALAPVRAEPGLEAPNVLQVAPDLVCSGQPKPASLQRLGALGFDAVIYLAPPTVGDAVPQEPEWLRSQGIEFVNVPMVWERPTLEQVDEVLGILSGWRGNKRKVLVHCQVNFRGSSLVFLHRVLGRQEPAEAAWADLSRVWSPNRTWMELIRSALRRAGHGFEPL
ncbi:protein tyrosine phosphatase family protein [Inhella sp.]|uniref:protein tyrosine phosphatase family protein n=1 Tax=Inhella sp. TaxID=1921806 RepID=UPI0035B11573